MKVDFIVKQCGDGSYVTEQRIGEEVYTTHFTTLDAAYDYYHQVVHGDGVSNTKRVEEYMEEHGIEEELHTRSKWRQMGQPVRDGEQAVAYIDINVPDRIGGGNHMVKTAFFMESQTGVEE